MLNKPVNRSVPQNISSKFFDAKEGMQDSHPHILDWFNGASKEVKSEIINAAFTKDKGRWVLDLDKPFFRECKQRCAKH